LKCSAKEHFVKVLKDIFDPQFNRCYGMLSEKFAKHFSSASVKQNEKYPYFF